MSGSTGPGRRARSERCVRKRAKVRVDAYRLKVFARPAKAAPAFERRFRFTLLNAIRIENSLAQAARQPSRGSETAEFAA
jgi:hypothetical protein